MANLNLKIFQFQQAGDFIKGASQILKERVGIEEDDKNEKHKVYNLRTYTQILLVKADRYVKMHDHELAFRALYKAQRVLRAMDKPDQSLWIRVYEQMATAHITQKELMQAHDYILKARAIQLELGAIEDVRQRKKKKAALDQVEKNKFALLGEKSRMFFQKKKEA